MNPTNTEQSAGTPEGRDIWLAAELFPDSEKAATAAARKIAIWRHGVEEALTAENARLRAQVMEWLRLAPDLGQLLSGWHQDGTAWSEWDQKVYERLQAIQSAHEAALVETRRALS